MKRILCTVAVLASLSFSAFADEGMWLLPFIKQMNAGAMAEAGCRLTPEQIYDINNSSLKDAIVQFGGGCTGEIISDEGLLVTNHHCGYSSIQGLSTPEHNYLEDGYWAMTRGQELPVPGLTVKFLESMTDVTEILDKAYDAALKAAKKAKAENPEESAAEASASARMGLISAAEADNPGCTAIVANYYNNNVAYLIVYRIYRDVRFVGAPPASLGKFGGETDNWMWPRHTCDFSMFRVYADKDNMPADYSEDNVPMRPKQSLKVSLKGVQDGDFAMIMGYPGRTQRFQTADQLEMMVAVNQISVGARTVRQRVMKEGMEADPVVRLKYSNKYASSANGWKKWQGQALSFEKLDIIGREKRKEADFMAWVGKNKKRQAKYGDALSQISSAVARQKAPYSAIMLQMETVDNIALFDMIATFATEYNEQDKADTAAAISSAVDATLKLYKDYDEALERRIAVAMLDFYLDNADPANIPEIEGVDWNDFDSASFVDSLFDNSLFSSAGRLESCRGKKLKEILDDPVMDIYNAFATEYLKLFEQYRAAAGDLSAGSKAFAAGLLEWKKGEPSYPDANSTMRLTYGNVKSYSPKDGVLYRHYTTLAGVIEKEDPGNYEFRVPEKIKELYNAKDYGQYANAAGELPTCFLTNNDITGGNSGSPVLNADGELIGLAFDGNWESMSSDVMFEPDLQRCICVDIRYVFFIMDKFGGAGHLLDEMNIVR